MKECVFDCAGIRDPEEFHDALVEALMEGKEAFKGQDPIDAYCGMFDTHM